MSGSRIEKIRQQLINELTPSFLDVIDESHMHRGHVGAQTGLGHFAIIISSAKFRDKKLLECHRMIYAALDNLMKTDIHALRIEIRN